MKMFTVRIPVDSSVPYEQKGDSLGADGTTPKRKMIVTAGNQTLNLQNVLSL
jgi:hypothetical protein